MSRKIHMQDQAFNKVHQIMQHPRRSPLQLNLGGLSITLQYLAETKAGFFKPPLKAISH